MEAEIMWMKASLQKRRKSVEKGSLNSYLDQASAAALAWSKDATENMIFSGYISKIFKNISKIFKKYLIDFLEC